MGIIFSARQLQEKCIELYMALYQIFLPGSLWLGVVIPAIVPSMEYLIIYSTWNHFTEWKRMINIE